MEVKGPNEEDGASIGTGNSSLDPFGTFSLTLEEDVLDFEDYREGLDDDSGMNSRPERPEDIEAEPYASDGVDRTEPKEVEGSNNLWISGLPLRTKAKDLIDVFSHHGQVVGAKILSSSRALGAKCFAFVTMRSGAEALACVRDQGKIKVFGTCVTVKLAQSKPPFNEKVEGENPDLEAPSDVGGEKGSNQRAGDAVETPNKAAVKGSIKTSGRLGVRESPSISRHVPRAGSPTPRRGTQRMSPTRKRSPPRRMALKRSSPKSPQRSPAKRPRRRLSPEQGSSRRKSSPGRRSPPLTPRSEKTPPSTPSVYGRLYPRLEKETLLQMTSPRLDALPSGHMSSSRRPLYHSSPVRRDVSPSRRESPARHGASSTRHRSSSNPDKSPSRRKSSARPDASPSRRRCTGRIDATPSRQKSSPRQDASLSRQRRSLPDSLHDNQQRSSTSVDRRGPSLDRRRSPTRRSLEDLFLGRQKSPLPKSRPTVSPSRSPRMFDVNRGCDDSRIKTLTPLKRDQQRPGLLDYTLFHLSHNDEFSRGREDLSSLKSRPRSPGPSLPSYPDKTPRSFVNPKTSTDDIFPRAEMEKVAQSHEKYSLVQKIFELTKKSSELERLRIQAEKEAIEKMRLATALYDTRTLKTCSESFANISNQVELKGLTNESPVNRVPLNSNSRTSPINSESNLARFAGIRDPWALSKPCAAEKPVPNRPTGIQGISVSQSQAREVGRLSRMQFQNPFGDVPPMSVQFQDPLGYGRMEPMPFQNPFGDVPSMSTSSKPFTPINPFSDGP